ncbi:MAG: FHA domain-containing protein [Bdellovibrionales bacterium]
MAKPILKIIKGSHKGKVYSLKNNMIIGRTTGDIVLKDHLISDPHAKIEIYSNDKIMLSDEDSKNGIFVDGEPKVKTVLEEGSKFSIGEHEFEVIFIKTPEETWREVLKNSLSLLKEDDAPIPLSSFSKELHLNFTKGYMQGNTWVLAYGPRSFGSESPDCPLFGESVPGEAFTFIPQGNKEILYETSYPHVVLINGKQLSEKIIEEGDVISLDSLEIKIQLEDVSL